MFSPQIPLSGGGVTYSWSSPIVIAMLVAGCVAAVIFVLYEWKLAPVPIMPCECDFVTLSNLCRLLPLELLLEITWRVGLANRVVSVRLFQARHCSYLYAQNFFTGLSYFGNFFYCKCFPPLQLRSAID